jgi:hypothetical protein
MSLAAMRKIAFGILIGACALVLCWYGWLFYVGRDARKVDGANLFVTFHSAPTQCDVRTGLYAVQHALPCEDVPSYIREDLKLAAGATFAVFDLGKHGPDVAALKAALESAGYHSVDGRRIDFITEPERPARAQ